MPIEGITLRDQIEAAKIRNRPKGKLFRVTKQTSSERPKKLFGSLWAQGETAFIFGEDGSGKTILDTQIGCSLATGRSIHPKLINEVPAQVVTVFDAELSDYQFNARYPDGLPDNFKRLVFDEAMQSQLARADVQYVVDQIELAANEHSSKIIILDNLSALASMADLTKTADSIQLMGLLNNLKKKGFSILIVDHCRKPMREGDFKTISKHDLQGSKMKTNLADSVFSIGKSCQGEQLRYIKALKIRSYQMEFTGSGVATIELKSNPLRFEYIGLNQEFEHVTDKVGQAMRLKHEGKSQTEIAQHLDITQQAVSKMLTSNECPF